MPDPQDDKETKVDAETGPMVTMEALSIFRHRSTSIDKGDRFEVTEREAGELETAGLAKRFGASAMKGQPS